MEPKPTYDDVEKAEEIALALLVFCSCLISFNPFLCATTMASLLLGAPPAILSHSRISSAQSQMIGSPLPSDRASSLSVRPAATASVAPLVYCGRGDKKTAKGKRFNHSFGNSRPRSKKHGRGPPRVPVPGAAPKKDPFEDTEVVKIDIDESLLPN